MTNNISITGCLLRSIVSKLTCNLYMRGQLSLRELTRVLVRDTVIDFRIFLILKRSQFADLVMAVI